ncbi:NINE protein [Streptomyces sp. NPDC057702]|uniref:TM2 domain-containing protein n=1 Tax=unclassified Streptomyces TaxID=2593676 RepID=UPI0036CE5305
MSHAHPYGAPHDGPDGPDGQPSPNPAYAVPSGPNPYATPQGQPGYGYPHSAQGQPSYGYPPLNVAPPVYAAYAPQLGGHLPAPDAPYGYDPYGRPYSDRSRVAAGVLQLVLGPLGIGRFYTGHLGMAFAQLLTCGGLLVWSLVDGILLLTSRDRTDATGRVLRG